MTMKILNRIHKYLQEGRQWYQRPLSQITKITVHHSAIDHDLSLTGEKLLENIKSSHSKKGWPGLSYHYVIDIDGTIYQTNKHEDITWHDAVNKDSIGVLVTGWFHPSNDDLKGNDKPTLPQLNSLKYLLDKLTTEHPEFPAGMKDVVGHRERSATVCPGDYLMPYVIAYREDKWEKVDVPSTVLTPDKKLPEEWISRNEPKLAIERRYINKTDAYVDQISKLVKLVDGEKEEVKKLQNTLNIKEEKIDTLKDEISVNAETILNITSKLSLQNEQIVDLEDKLSETASKLSQCLSMEVDIDNGTNVPVIIVKTFPDWKKALIEFRRVFVGASIAQILILIPTVPTWLGDVIKEPKMILGFLIIPVLTAGYRGITKYLQDTYGNQEYDKLIYKL